ncbi:MAG TPA: HlyD family efflux transporter periplasmic adaptor subunit [Terriglobales bacterium]|nr:HlyD family efflux transporter periplasmic adaptor subunit [Terriglobales bacterium]
MKSKMIVILVVVAVVVLMALGANTMWRGKPEKLSASGTLEARNIGVGSKVGGRITKVLANEGDRVEANQLLVTFDDAELSAKVTQARGRVAQAQATVDKMMHGSRPEEIAEAQAAVVMPDGSRGYRAEEVSQAKADLARTQAEVSNADKNFKRMKQLADEGVISRQLKDDAEERLRVAQAQVQTAQHAVSAAEGRLKAAAAVQKKTERGSRREDIDFARADLMRAQGELKEMEARWLEREVRSPTAAVIEVMDVRPGDLIPANAQVAKLLESDQLFVVVYVPQTQIGSIHLGQSAQVFVDGFPKQGFPAKVEQIRQQAEFIPRNVQTKEERVHQVIGVKLRVENKDNKLRAGVSAEVSFDSEAK